MRLDLAGLGDAGYRFHDLRHTCVSRLVAAGADVKLVQAVAGHANPLITLKRYSHLLDARGTEAATGFDPAKISLAERWNRAFVVTGLTTGLADLQVFSDGAYRDRTGDLRLAKPALSQLS